MHVKSALRAPLQFIRNVFCISNTGYTKLPTDLTFSETHNTCIKMYVCVLIYYLPDIKSLAKHLDAVKVCNGSVHSVLISHLN